MEYIYLYLISFLIVAFSEGFSFKNLKIFMLSFFFIYKKLQKQTNNSDIELN